VISATPRRDSPAAICLRGAGTPSVNRGAERRERIAHRAALAPSPTAQAFLPARNRFDWLPIDGIVSILIAGLSPNTFPISFAEKPISIAFRADASRIGCHASGFIRSPMSKDIKLSNMTTSAAEFHAHRQADRLAP
jgi:hypothetical protein